MCLCSSSAEIPATNADFASDNAAHAETQHTPYRQDVQSPLVSIPDLTQVKTPSTPAVITETLLNVLQDQSQAFKEFTFYAKQSLLQNKNSDLPSATATSVRTVTQAGSQNNSDYQQDVSYSRSRPSSPEPTANNGHRRARSSSVDSSGSLSCLLQAQSAQHDGI